MASKEKNIKEKKIKDDTIIQLKVSPETQISIKYVNLNNYSKKRKILITTDLIDLSTYKKTQDNYNWTEISFSALEDFIEKIDNYTCRTRLNKIQTIYHAITTGTFTREIREQYTDAEIAYVLLDHIKEYQFRYLYHTPYFRDVIKAKVEKQKTYIDKKLEELKVPEQYSIFEENQEWNNGIGENITYYYCDDCGEKRELDLYGPENLYLAYSDFYYLGREFDNLDKLTLCCKKCLRNHKVNWKQDPQDLYKLLKKKEEMKQDEKQQAK